MMTSCAEEITSPTKFGSRIQRSIKRNPLASHQASFLSIWIIQIIVNRYAPCKLQAEIMWYNKYVNTQLSLRSKNTYTVGSPDGGETERFALKKYVHRKICLCTLYHSCTFTGNRWSSRLVICSWNRYQPYNSTDLESYNTNINCQIDKTRALEKIQEFMKRWGGTFETVWIFMFPLSDASNFVFQTLVWWDVKFTTVTLDNIR